VIAIDPKGDMGNLLLTFPGFSGADFRPWISERAAAESGSTPEEFATAEAAFWKKGLADWGQDGERVAALKAAADFAIYTPGSAAGQPISVLKTFAAPGHAGSGELDQISDRVQRKTPGVHPMLGLDCAHENTTEHQ
jgi:hypothetical protein